MLITHDRAFLDGVATRIVELDRGILRSYPGNFSAYERMKEEQLAPTRWPMPVPTSCWRRKRCGSARASKRAAPAAWPASSGWRCCAASARHGEIQLGQVRLEIDAGAPSGKIVAELTDVGMRFGDKLIAQGFNATILRGDKIGLVGPNGAGKTTLLKLILGELQPTSGKVRQGTKLEVAYFDQMRAGLDLDATLADTISPGSEWVEFNGQRKHVMSYLNDFLFSPERANSPVRTLSGGERNRVLLARPVRAAGQRAGARRTHQRPRHRHAGAAGRTAAELPRHGVPGQPRPALPRQRGHQPDLLGRRPEPRPLARVRRRHRRLAGPACAHAGGAGRGSSTRPPRPNGNRHRRRWPPRRPPGASSATRSSASGTNCRPASRRWKPSRPPSAPGWPTARCSPRRRPRPPR
jgi:hypothetical protein